MDLVERAVLEMEMVLEHESFVAGGMGGGRERVCAREFELQQMSTTNSACISMDLEREEPHRADAAERRLRTRCRCSGDAKKTKINK